MSSVFGFERDSWNLARDQARSALIASARNEEPIYYSDLVAKINAIRLDLGAHKDRTALGRLLGEISTQTDEEGKGMLSAVVVSKDANMPTGGFFNLAEDLGYQVGDKTEFWIEQYKKVIATWRP